MDLKGRETDHGESYNDELHDLYSSPYTVRVIKSRMRWVRHVARMGEVFTGFWLGGPKGKDH
jgi:hypothetical protein